MLWLKDEIMTHHILEYKLFSKRLIQEQCGIYLVYYELIARLEHWRRQAASGTRLKWTTALLMAFSPSTSSLPRTSSRLTTPTGSWNHTVCLKSSFTRRAVYTVYIRDVCWRSVCFFSFPSLLLNYYPIFWLIFFIRKQVYFRVFVLIFALAEGKHCMMFSCCYFAPFSLLPDCLCFSLSFCTLCFFLLLRLDCTQAFYW